VYYPLLRGKQYELILVRENAHRLASAHFVPIIEPVRASMASLERVVAAVSDQHGRVAVLVNPACGDDDVKPQSIQAVIDSAQAEVVVPTVLVSAATSFEDCRDLIERNASRESAILHMGFADPTKLASLIEEHSNVQTNVFLEAHCGKLYRRHFKHGRRILVRDGFQKKKNRDYPPEEFFSDLHETFDEEGMQGFGDFLIVGDEFSEAGGPAYAVALHLTYIDRGRDNAMYVRHYVSDQMDTPTDPAGKFYEAVSKVVEDARRRESKLLRTDAVEEFIGLYEEKQYPGLGYAKKLCMQHHIEVMAAHCGG
jgi:hypothetical protein